MRRAALWLLPLAGCADLPELPRSVCGNAIVEDGEDCESVSSGELASCLPPGEEGACHYDCSVGSDGRPKPCLPGWVCAVDQLCRRPTGAFEAPQRYSVGDVASLAAGDFDGDGRADLLSRNPSDTSGRSTLGFHYFDARAALSESRPYRNLVLSPAVASLRGEGLADVVFTDYRVGVLLGQRDRSWVPEAFTPYAVPDGVVRLTGVRDGSIDGVAPLVTLRALGEGPGLSTADAASNTIVLRAPVTSPLQGLLGDPLPVRVVETPSSGCDELVLAFRGERALQSFSLCGPERADGVIPWSARASVATIALVPPAQLEAPPIAGDVNGDGHLDVLVGAGGLTYAALGDGRTLAPAVPFVPVPEPLLNDPALSAAQLGTPLAVGDLSGDGAADFVFPSHIVLSSMPTGATRPRHQVVASNADGRWDRAVIADLNGNGFADVVASQRDRLHVDFYNGSARPWLLASRISTVRPVAHLTTGDFDGDLIGDLALVEPASRADERDTVKVAWGALSQVPAAPQTVARARAVQQIGSFREAGADSLLVVAAHPSPDDPRELAYLFGGNAERTPFAALELNQFSQDGTIANVLATSLVVGAFASGAAKDALVLAAEWTKGTWHFWLVPAVDSASPAARALAGALDPRLSPSSSPVGLPLKFPAVRIYATGVAADLDVDGRDEAIWVMPADQETRCGIETFAVRGQGPELALASGGLVVLDAPCKHPQIAVVDADEDGRLDLVVLTGSEGAADRKLFVLWNDGSGRFAAERSTQVSGAADSPQAFAILPKTAGAPLSLVYATEQAVVQWRYEVGTRTFGGSTSIATLRKGSGIVAADLDGDGALDLAVADDGDIAVLRAQVR
ncbi:MAG: VCBS repeat-containing protein [Polyangiales bacterium]